MTTIGHRVVIYGKKECCLCDQALEVLEKVRASVPFELEKIDISVSHELLAAFSHEIPVIFVNGIKAFRYRVNENHLRALLD